MGVKTCRSCGAVIGATRPTHMHICTAGDEVHTWQCDSAYCGAKERDCEDHGGEKPRSE